MIVGLSTIAVAMVVMVLACVLLLLSSIASLWTIELILCQFYAFYFKFFCIQLIFFMHNNDICHHLISAICDCCIISWVYLIFMMHVLGRGNLCEYEHQSILLEFKIWKEDLINLRHFFLLLIIVIEKDIF